MRARARSRLLVALVVAAVIIGCGREATPDPEVADPPADPPAEPADPPAEPTDPTDEAPAERAEPDDDGEPDPPVEPEDPAPPGTAVGPRVEAPVRGAWVHLFDDTLKTRAGIAGVVEELAAAGATDVVAQVARRHDAYYRSMVLPATPDPDLEDGLDVVDELVRQSHAAGLRVHAWVTVAPTWHHVYDDLDAPDGWLPVERGLAAPESRRWVTRTYDGAWSEFLDPALPEVQAHVARVAVELADRYPIDGIHLDYVRYASERHGYHPTAVARYRDETGASDTPRPDDPAWAAWRRERTHELVREVRAALDAAGSEVALSAATIAWGAGPGHPDAPRFEDTRSFTEALQDWPAWVRAGSVDAVMPMVYFRAHVPEQAAWFAAWAGFHRELAADTEVLVVPGVGGWLNTSAAVLDQVGTAAHGTDGVLIYSFQQPADDPTRQILRELGTSGWGGAGG